MSDWKPGDVAMLSAYNRREEYRAYYDGKTWREYGADMFCVDEPMTLRPLVVIDPEDREQCDGLADALTGVGVRNAGWDLVRPALRSLVAPPRPDEPTGLGAVVADTDGQLWVRTDYKHPWCATYDDDSGESRNYADVRAVRVLSEGVTP